jgi:hypothetical protein
MTFEFELPGADDLGVVLVGIIRLSRPGGCESGPLHPLPRPKKGSKWYCDISDKSTQAKMPAPGLCSKSASWQPSPQGLKQAPNAVVKVGVNASHNVKRLMSGFQIPQ